MSENWYGMRPSVLDETPNVTPASPSIGDYLSMFQTRNKEWRESIKPVYNQPYRVAVDGSIADPIVNAVPVAPANQNWLDDGGGDDGSFDNNPTGNPGLSGNPTGLPSVDGFPNDPFSMSPQTKSGALNTLGGLLGGPFGGLAAQGIGGEVLGVPSEVTGYGIGGGLLGGALFGLPGAAIGNYLGRNYGAVSDFSNQFGVRPGFMDSLAGAFGFATPAEVAGRTLGLSGYGDHDSFSDPRDPFGAGVEDDIGAMDPNADMGGGGDGGGRDDGGHNTDGGRSDRSDKDGDAGTW